MPIRGGNWNNGALNGVFALNVNNARSDANTNIGARPASGERLKRLAYAAWRPYPLKRTWVPRQYLSGAEIRPRQAVPVAP